MFRCRAGGSPGSFPREIRGFQLPPYCLRQQGPTLGSFAGETPRQTTRQLLVHGHSACGADEVGSVLAGGKVHKGLCLLRQGNALVGNEHEGTLDLVAAVLDGVLAALHTLHGDHGNGVAHSGQRSVADGQRVCLHSADDSAGGGQLLCILAAVLHVHDALKAIAGAGTGLTTHQNDLAVIAALTEGFAEIEPDVTISYDPTGSGAGITGAADKTLDIGLSSRALKADETGVTGTIVALDGIAIIVNKDSKVEDLTVDQLKQMFTGEITNWKDVGGDDGEIVLVGREAGSGTRDGFESIVDVKDSCKYAQELTATGAVISAVEANPLAIGYASLSAIGDTVKAVTVGGVECSEETVKDGSYEVQRPFVFVTNDSVTLSAQAQAFFDFAASTDAADLIRTAGAVPVNE